MLFSSSLGQLLTLEAITLSLFGLASYSAFLLLTFCPLPHGLSADTFTKSHTTLTPLQSLTLQSTSPPSRPPIDRTIVIISIYLILLCLR